MDPITSKLPPVAKISIALLLVSSVMVGAVPVSAQQSQVIGSPDLSASIQDNHLEPSEETQVSVSLSNAGEIQQSGPQQFTERVQTARNVRVSIDESAIDAPISIKSGTVSLGALQSGSVREAVFTVESGADLEPGTYQIPIEVRYTYTGMVNYEQTQSGYTNIENVDYTESTTLQSNIVVEDQPSFSLSGEPTNQLQEGSSDYFNFTVTNSGTERAEEITVDLTSQNPAVQFSTGSASQSSQQSAGQSQTSVFVPALDPGESYEASVRVFSTATAPVDQYSLQATVNYKDPAGFSDASDPITLGGDIRSGQRFGIGNLSSSLYVGEEGNLTGTVTNTGSNTAIDATVNVQNADSALELQRTSYPVGDLAPGESATIRFPVTAPDGTDSGPYQFGFTVDYEDRAGNQFSSKSLNSQVTIGEKRNLFRLGNVSSSLRAGEEGNVTATLTKIRSDTVRDAVVEIQAEGTGLEPQRTTFPVGNLDQGESATVRFPITATESIDAGPYQFGFTVNYEDSENTQLTSSTLNSQVTVGEERDVFAVSGSNTTLPVGSSGPVEIQLTNTDDEVVRNINAKAFVDDPVSASSDEAYVEALEPGESTTIAFDMSVASDASARPRPIEMDFQYEEPDGDTVISDTYQVALELTEPEQDGGGGLPLLVGGALIVGAVVAVGLYLRRRSE